MKVFGYTQGKRVVEANVSIARIVAAGIDPWRLDAFDDNPITMTVWAGWRPRKLRFSRLSDLSFRYEDAEANVVAMHDGSTGICVKRHQNGTREILTDLPSFNSAFARYLQTYLQTRERTQLADLRPRAAQAFILKGSEVQFDTSMRQIDTSWRCGTPEFVGNMLEPVRLPIKLPEPLDWLVETLKNWHPVISGDAVSLALAGGSSKNIFAYIERSALKPISELLTVLNIRHSTSLDRFYGLDPGCVFHHHDCNYHLSAVETDEIERNLRDKLSERGLCIRQPDEVCGNRMQFFARSKAGNRLPR